MTEETLKAYIKSEKLASFNHKIALIIAYKTAVKQYEAATGERIPAEFNEFLRFKRKK